MNKNLVIVPLISALFLTFASCGKTFFTSDGETWGTSYHIVYASERALDSEIAEELRRIDSELSMFNPASTVSAVNSGELTEATEDFAAVFTLAKRVAELSGGVYDPTVAPLTDLWGFGRKGGEELPADSAVARVLASVGIAECSIDSAGVIHKKSRATEFDFSSIAKGYGIDCIASLLERHGVTDYMVEIGGEVTARGESPRKGPWRIQIDSPASGSGHERLGVLELGPDRMSVASSGNYRRFRTDSSGNIMGHTISPLTGRPVAGRVLAATVRAADCAYADAVATACMAAADPDSAGVVLRRADVAGMLVVAEGDSLALRYFGF